MEDRRILSFDAQSVVNQVEASLGPLRAGLPVVVPDGSNSPFELKWSVER